ncbi:MAG: hypothetical protein R2769_17540 [Saprospiraceae bacterium]
MNPVVDAEGDYILNINLNGTQSCSGSDTIHVVLERHLPFQFLIPFIPAIVSWIAAIIPFRLWLMLILSFGILKDMIP